ncbi:hypothetical protein YASMINEVIRUS_587 [Yasminevirus sp. GU-2018]|uniref:Uncharacterized protein n=1 Tax=Yasminevirus sp. GU-2018 TaxID=2420051 RepID=A0A5K0U9E9_9VIRU|nr:hypothetical protein YASMINEVIRUS_587 [Yasminevirus sp. GU-2018]
MTTTYNRAIRCIGPDVVITAIEQFALFYKMPVVSIGSGLAQIEFDAQKSVKEKGFDVELICVDPDPKSFAKNDEPTVYIEPAFPHVKDLIDSKPDIVGSCVLFLNWCCPNESEYDFEAIQLLKPVGVMTICERFNGGAGAAGGAKFHKWLERVWGWDVPQEETEVKAIEQEGNQNKETDDNSCQEPDVCAHLERDFVPYREVRSIELMEIDDIENEFNPTLIWIHRTDCEEPDNVILRRIPSCVRPLISTSGGCSIM